MLEQSIKDLRAEVLIFYFYFGDLLSAFPVVFSQLDESLSLNEQYLKDVSNLENERNGCKEKWWLPLGDHLCDC